jgi:histidinol-phosphate aminotransferase
LPLPRSTVFTLAPAIHGARDYTELKRLNLNPDPLIDFSANSNPYGPHPAVLQAVRAAVMASTLACYPDRDSLALRAAIANTEQAPIESILPGNGATELIYLVALTYVQPGSRHLILCPTFGEYARVIALMGGLVYEHRPQTYTSLYLETSEIAAIIRRVQPDGVWLCNPNNPTGQYWQETELAQMRSADPNGEMLWVIDESYRHFVAPQIEQPSGLPVCPPNLIRLRSLTKDYSLAGLRLGYVLAAPEIINMLRVVQPSWSVNSLAQIAGVAALQPTVMAWREQTLAQLQQDAAQLWAELIGIGLTVLPTSTPFALVNAAGNAADLRRRLLERGLLVRDGASFGLPDYIRVAARRPQENRQLVKALKSLVTEQLHKDSPSLF